MAKNITAIIPARYESSRLPGKPLIEFGGKPMIVHVVERTLRSKLLKNVLVATDDKRIYEAVLDHGYDAVMTRASHKSGTDRVAEAAKLIESEIIVNVQGDEPLIDHRNIDMAVKPLINDRSINVSTLSTPVKNIKDAEDPNIVKVAADKNNYALYFSRSLIPYRRDEQDVKYYKHIGLYVFRLGFLFRFIHMKQTSLEKAEKLEQLRILENGEKIYVVRTNIDSVSVDTEDDVKKVRKLLNSK